MLALVPIKSLMQAKQRLASLLSVSERAGLSFAMARDVLAALRATPEISRIVICTSDTNVAALAREFRADLVAEQDLDLVRASQTDVSSGGLNAVVSRLSRRFASGGIRKLLVVHADLPLLQPTDIATLVRAMSAADVAVAPDHARDGSNLLAWRLDTAFEPMYGENSFQRHCDQAQALGLLLRVCPQPSARWDIDKPADLLTLATMRPRDRALHTQAFLRDSGIATRLMTGRTPQAIAGVAQHARH